jgi:hypothetical protein
MEESTEAAVALANGSLPPEFSKKSLQFCGCIPPNVEMLLVASGEVVVQPKQEIPDKLLGPTLQTDNLLSSKKAE